MFACYVVSCKDQSKNASFSWCFVVSRCKGVTASAQCCMVSGLTCDYRVAGPSLSFDGAQAEAKCDVKTLPLGERSYHSYLLILLFLTKRQNPEKKLDHHHHPHHHHRSFSLQLQIILLADLHEIQ